MNPYFSYVFSFSMALIAYSLGWSELYPPLSLSLLLFLIGTLAVHLYIGTKVWRFRSIEFRPILLERDAPPIIITTCLYILWTCEFIYEGGIPLIKILFGQEYNYRLFGIPSLHVFNVTFASFYTVYLFNVYLSRPRKLILALCMINLFAAILIYSRAMFMFNLAGCFFLLVSSTVKVNKLLYAALPLVALALLCLFGALGTMRVSREAGESYDRNLFLDIGKATPTFRESLVPKEFFWTYIYVTSPLANLQHNIDTHSGHEVTWQSIAGMVNNEILMDFISKRINQITGSTRKSERTIPGPFNVSTAYSRAFSYCGWIGMIIMGLVILLTPWIYMKLLPAHSLFFSTGFAILCTMFLFLAYDNTIRFTGLSFQLVYPVLLDYACKRSARVKNFFVNNNVTGV